MPGLPSDEMRARLLIIDDDPSTSSSLAEMLTNDGYDVSVAESGAAAKATLQELHPQLVILDLMVRDVDGLMLCADIKNSTGIPVIVCSATRRRHDRVLALRLGADDFVAKPFDFDELQARVTAVLRRARVTSSTSPDEPQQLRVGSLVVDPSRHLVAVGDQEMQTTPTEYRLLIALASRPEGAFSRKLLAEAVWGYDVANMGRAIDIHVSRLKRKLLAYAGHVPRIASVRGEGYKLVLDRSGPPEG